MMVSHHDEVLREGEWRGPHKARALPVVSKLFHDNIFWKQ